MQWFFQKCSTTGFVFTICGLCALILFSCECRVCYIRISELPKNTGTDAIIKHKAYTLSYNEQYEQANWVAYILTDESGRKKVKRKDEFREDELVLTGTANDKDYKRSGYDRGHLAPAGDMVFDKTAMSESFFYSNMSPQNPGFNRGIWKNLEEKVRDWAARYDTVWVVTGPVLEPGMPVIGANEVSVPYYYYKVLLIKVDDRIEGIGFVMENEESKASFFDNSVTIDYVEGVTGIDFFPSLPDEFEEDAESRVELSYWR